MADKLTDEDKETINSIVSENESWFDLNRDTCSKDEIDERHKSMQEKLSPIMNKLIGQQGDMPGGMPEDMAQGAGPTIDEVD